MTTVPGKADRGPDIVLSGLALATTFLVALFLQDAALVAAGGGLAYGNDVPYLHLAAAARFASGGLAALPPEAIDAASQAPLYTALLIPFLSTNLAEQAPLILTAVGLVLSALMWGHILWQSGLGGRMLGVAMAIIGPVALYIPGHGVSAAGHILYLAAALAILVGLIDALDDRQANRTLMWGVLFAPLLRVDGIALGLAAALFVFLAGRRAAGFGLALLSLAPMTLLSFWLATSGVTLSDIPWVVAVLDGDLSTRIATQVNSPGGLTMAVALLVAAVAVVLAKDRRAALGAALISGSAALILIDTGGTSAAEAVPVAVICAALIAVLNQGAVLRGLAVFPLALAGAVYVPLMIGPLIESPRAMHLGPGQIGRLAVQHLDAPIAVDRLGPELWRPDLAHWPATGDPASDVQWAATVAQVVPGTEDVGLLTNAADASPEGQITLASTVEGRAAFDAALTEWAATLPEDAAFLKVADR